MIARDFVCAACLARRARVWLASVDRDVPVCDPCHYRIRTGELAVPELAELVRHEGRVLRAPRVQRLQRKPRPREIVRKWQAAEVVVGPDGPTSRGGR